MTKMNRLLVAVASATLLSGSVARPAQAQYLTPVVGFVNGVATGGYITLSLVVLRAQNGHYLHEMSDLFSWRSFPVIIGAVTSTTVSIVDADRFWGGFVFGTAGTVLGTGIGYLVGPQIWPRPEGKWAGAAVGAGVGMTVGSIAGLIWPQSQMIPKEIRHLSVIPVKVSVPF